MKGLRKVSMNHLVLLKETFTKKIFLIIAVGVVCAFLAGAEKYYTKDIKVQTGPVVVVREVQFVDPDEKNNLYPFRYDDYMRSPGNVCRFIKSAESNKELDILALNSDWYKMNIEKKYLWLDKTLLIKFFGEGRCELTMYLNVNTPKDAGVYAEQENKFMDAYLDSTLAGLKSIKPNVHMQTLQVEEYMPDTVNLPKRNIVCKYAALGFTLGVMVSTFALFVVALRKK